MDMCSVFKETEEHVNCIQRDGSIWKRHQGKIAEGQGKIAEHLVSFPNASVSKDTKCSAIFPWSLQGKIAEGLVRAPAMITSNKLKATDEYAKRDENEWYVQKDR